MAELGRIVKLQIQTDLLARDHYDPAPLYETERLLLTPSGALAWCDGGWTVDSHHRDFPGRRYWNQDRALSVGFTSHYEAMAAHFGRAPLGCAGENVTIEADHQISPEELLNGLVIEADGRRVELGGLRIAQPCVPFTEFMLGAPTDNAQVEVHRDFLRGGMRGFVTGLDHLSEPTEIREGDRVSTR
ncbi:MAG: MOSC domain-containing protein [Acidimicrobiia bacterium]